MSDKKLSESQIDFLQRTIDDPNLPRDLRVAVRTALLNLWELEILFGSRIARKRKENLESKIIIR